MSSSKKTTQTTAIPPWLEQASQQAVALSSRAANRPLITYGRNYSDEIARGRAFAAPTTSTATRADGFQSVGGRFGQLIFQNPQTGERISREEYQARQSQPAPTFASDTNVPYTPAELEAMRLADSPRFAELDPNEQMAYDRARTGAGAYESDLERARQLTERGAGTFLDADVQAYMNPYIKGALDPAARELRDQTKMDMQDARKAAAMAGAFGGSRATLLESERRRGGTQAISDLYAKGYAAAFESAAERFDADRNAAARGAEQFRALGSQRQAQLAQEINNLLTTGGLKRQLEQAKLDFNFEQFTTARDWDVNNLKPLLAALSSVPHGTTTTNEARTSAMANIVGLASTVAGAFFGGSGGGGGQQGGDALPAGNTGGGGGTFNQGDQGPPEPGSPTAWRGLVPVTNTFQGAYA